MSKQKYSPEMYQKAAELRLAGHSTPEIEELTGIKKDAQNKYFHQYKIKMSPEAAAEAKARRWKDHQPIVDGRLQCCRCEVWKDLADYNANAKTKTGLNYACRDCVSKEYFDNAEDRKERMRKYREDKRS